MTEAAGRRGRLGSLLTLLLPLLIGLGALATIELGGTMAWLLVQPTATVLSALVLLSSREAALCRARGLAASPSLALRFHATEPVLEAHPAC